MSTVIIVIHLMVVVAMVGLVLLQRSEGGALGIGGGGGGGGAFMSGRGAANMLTRSTAVLAAAFFATSVGLALLAKMDAGQTDIFQNLPGQSQPAETDTPVVPLPSGGGSAQDMLQQLDGAAGPQTPPAEGGTPPTPPAQ